MTDTSTVKCPRCSEALAYNGETSQWECAHCGGAFSDNDLLGNSAGGDSGTTERPALDYKLYGCPGCKTEFWAAYDAEYCQCPYCGQPIEQKEKPQEDFAPEMMIPFQITRNQAAQKFKEVLSKGLLSANLYVDNCADKIQQVYLPCWLYSGKVQVKLNGKISGNNKTLSYEARISRMPLTTSTHISSEELQMAEPFIDSDYVPVSGESLSDVLIERCQVSKEALTDAARPKVVQAISPLVKRLNPNFEPDNTYQATINMGSPMMVLLPVWRYVVSHQYHKLNLVLNGSSGEFCYTPPLSNIKYLLGQVLVFAAVAALMILFFYTVFTS